MSQKSVPEFAVHKPAMPRKKRPGVARRVTPYTETRTAALKKKSTGSGRKVGLL